MTEFTWNGGGAWQGRTWTPDLPTDAALLFYLFAAFLEAPRCAQQPCKYPDTAQEFASNTWAHLIMSCLRCSSA